MALKPQDGCVGFGGDLGMRCGSRQTSSAGFQVLELLADI
jgi:hypothetical protein